ncbi:MAG: nitroreductase family deazaflavin-dependent oxidoreductase [Thermoleophilaceae bacterium]|nr:nitroreductase family deazaflavin-dependent oxidoreductase [Thermoleophilaceae bacterium]
MRPIPQVNPVQQKNLMLRSMEAGVATRPGTWFFKNFVRHFEPTMIRMSGGKLQFGSGPRVNVTAPGRKSGEPRTATLLYFTRGDEVILIASNFGGEHFPAWYYNVKAAGEADLQWNGGGGKYTAREAEEPERTALFELAKKLYSGYDNYAKKTAGIRKIPVMVLTPAPDQ